MTVCVLLTAVSYSHQETAPNPTTIRLRGTLKNANGKSQLIEASISTIGNDLTRVLRQSNRYNGRSRGRFVFGSRENSNERHRFSGHRSNSHENRDTSIRIPFFKISENPSSNEELGTGLIVGAGLALLIKFIINMIMGMM